MEKYFKTTFWTIFGLRDLINLGDFVYGEFIIYDGNIPAYHVNCFRKNSVSDALVNQLLAGGKESIESAIRKINGKQGTKLNFGKSPLLIRIEKKEEIVELDLPPLPENWIKDILI
ncbi:hypothetical protein [Mucilaginibacter flavidus]|uniref:hypothetical protein n=1 Tax=Mucilaginibacter flavidus TaxID=2949309 RepID=UPI00209328D0|nr:hypothetical protein [Mucilaginibacter flavidus]MCO5947582.1 hypothetical protein [Mucilaginibacter flavidus]